jgi:hypothetical protein
LNDLRSADAAHKLRSSGLAKLLQIVRKLPGPLELEKGEDKKESPPLTSFSAEVDMAFTEAQDTSIRAHILASNFYLALKDYELVADIAQAGINLAKATESQIGLRLSGSVDRACDGVPLS